MGLIEMSRPSEVSRGKGAWLRGVLDLALLDFNPCLHIWCLIMGRNWNLSQFCSHIYCRDLISLDTLLTSALMLEALSKSTETPVQGKGFKSKLIWINLSYSSAFCLSQLKFCVYVHVHMCVRVSVCVAMCEHVFVFSLRSEITIRRLSHLISAFFLRRHFSLNSSFVADWQGPSYEYQDFRTYLHTWLFACKFGI